MYGPDKADPHLVDHVVDLDRSVAARTGQEDVVCTRTILQGTYLNTTVITTGKALGKLGQGPRWFQ